MKGRFERPYVGMTATAEIEVGVAPNAIVVPSEAVKVEKGQKVVVVPDGDGHKQVPVEVELDNGLKAEIKSGLVEGQEILIVYTISAEAKPGGRPPMRRW